MIDREKRQPETRMPLSEGEAVPVTQFDLTLRKTTQ